MAMGPGEQFVHAVWHGPASIRKLRGRGWAWWFFYLACAAGILGLIGWQFVEHRADMVGWVASYIFPESWRFAAQALIDYFFKSQLRAVVINAIIGASLMVVQVLLFPVKEKLSATFEKEAKVADESPGELPLWVEGIEEVQLFILFLTAQMTIFWIGYSPEPFRKFLALVLSYLFLFASFGIDFISPIMQRHRLKYSTMFKTFWRHPVAVVAFGAVFTLPPILVGRAVLGHEDYGLGTSVALLFGANVVCVAWAAVAGTWVGARLLPDARETKRPSMAARALVVAAVLALLVWNAWRFGAVGMALHHKSQILKCEYSVDWSSVGFDKPSWKELLARKVKVGVHADVKIKNPTKYDVELEDNRVEVRHRGDKVAQLSLTPVRIPAGQEVKQRMAFPIEVSPAVIAKGRDLIDPKGWEITMYLEVAQGFEFPVYLMEPTK